MPLVKLIEPPYAERLVRWCERTGAQRPLLLDLFADTSFCSPAPFGGRFLINFFCCHSPGGAGHLPVAGTGSPTPGQVPGSGRRQQFHSQSFKITKGWIRVGRGGARSAGPHVPLPKLPKYRGSGSDCGRASDVLHHFFRFICRSGLQDQVEHPDQFACHSDQ